jgi:hypothetical protein
MPLMRATHDQSRKVSRRWRRLTHGRYLSTVVVISMVVIVGKAVVIGAGRE